MPMVHRRRQPKSTRTRTAASSVRSSTSPISQTKSRVHWELDVIPWMWGFCDWGHTLPPPAVGRRRSVSPGAGGRARRWLCHGRASAPRKGRFVPMPWQADADHAPRQLNGDLESVNGCAFAFVRVEDFRFHGPHRAAPLRSRPIDLSTRRNSGIVAGGKHTKERHGAVPLLLLLRAALRSREGEGRAQPSD